MNETMKVKIERNWMVVLGAPASHKMVSGRRGHQKEAEGWDFPGGPAVKHLPSSAGGTSSIPGWGTKN